MAPARILDAFAALMLMIAAVSAARLAAERPWRRGMASVGMDVAHLLMAIAMAGKLAAVLATFPDTGWEAVFGLATAWFAWQVWLDARAHGFPAVAGGHCAAHLVHSGAMLYMLLAVPPPAGGPGMRGTAAMTPRYPSLAFAFALILAGYSIRDLGQHSGTPCGPGWRTGSSSARTLLLSPGTAAGCRVAMGLTMAFMLVMMI